MVLIQELHDKKRAGRKSQTARQAVPAQVHDSVTRVKNPLIETKARPTSLQYVTHINSMRSKKVSYAGSRQLDAKLLEYTKHGIHAIRTQDGQLRVRRAGVWY
jgi:hypothetical protein